ncbi:MAG: 30S ribosomal protein S3 [Patescibacteria group bacterium]
MGQKVNPISFRLGSYKNWTSLWFADKGTYSKHVVADFELRKYLNQKLKGAGVVEVTIERSITAIKVTLHVSRPGVVIGRGGANLEEVKKDVEKMLKQFKESKVKVEIRVEEVKDPDLSSKLVVERIADQLAKRYPHRRAVQQAMEKVMGAGAKGVKIALTGRIGGAEIGRAEKYFQGSIPTQTLRANIDYYQHPAYTRSGYVGIKVWIYKGEIAD